MLARVLVSGVLAVAVAAVVGCRPPTGSPTRPAASPKATPKASRTTPPADGLQGATQLTGKVKLIADARAGLISDSGGGLVSDAGGALISDQGGALVGAEPSGIISNNTGGIVSNNAGGLVANNGGAYRLHAAPALTTFALADATIAFTDAAGAPVRDAEGRPLTTKTDAQGGYRLSADLPAGNLVARVALPNGGELRALLVPAAGAVTLDLDTASTLGATYVLDRFVKGEQAVLDRLPRPEADRLRAELDAVRGYLALAPSYRPGAMVAATEALRTRVATVDRAIEDVKALLLGQAQLGNGRRGTEVPLAGPQGLLVDRDGTLLIGEGFIGRVRVLAKDGTLSTLVDAGSGTIKTNFLRLEDLARAPDGTLYAASKTTGIFKVAPDGTHAALFLKDAPALGGRDANPRTLAVGADGTLYVGEFTYLRSGVAPRLIAVAPNGAVSTIAVDPAWVGGRISGLAVAPDGALVVGYEDAEERVTIYRHQAGATTRVAGFADGGGLADLGLAPDGKILLARPALRQVVSLAADGTPTPMAGAGGPAASGGLRRPSSLAVAPDGTLYVADEVSSRVHALRPDGTFAAVAGADALDERGDTTAFAINQPTGLAFDDAGALYVAEAGSGRVRKFQGGALTVVAGTELGFGGDGGPADQAQLEVPTAVAHRAGALWIGEIGTGRIRQVDPTGIIRTLTGTTGSELKAEPGAGEVPLANKPLPALVAMALDPQGRAVVATKSHQVMRFTPGANGGTARVLAGQRRGDGPEVYGPASYLENDETDPAGVLGYPNGIAFGPGGDVYFAELVACRVSKIVGLDGPGPVRLERVAGRTVADMFAHAGDAQTSPDGIQATAGHLVFPSAVVFDRQGNMYVSEAGTIHIGALGGVADQAPGSASFGEVITQALGMPRIAGRVRKIAPDGVITTIAGRGSRFFPDDGGDDALIMPMALAIAPDGRLAIADVGANMIRILPAGSY